MKATYIGKFDLGCENVSLFVREGGGGEFVTNPDPAIFIGLSCDWIVTVQILIHEVTEFVAFRRGSRMVPDNNMSNDAGSCWFIMDHAKFSDICGGLAMFLIPALPFVEIAWKEHHKKLKSNIAK